MKLLEFASIQMNFPKLWHMTDQVGLDAIKKDDGFMYPRIGLRTRLAKARGLPTNGGLFFFTSLDEDVLDEVHSVIRFGGLKGEDDPQWKVHENKKLFVLEFDMNEVKEFDEQTETDRTWFQDDSMEHGTGVWTPQPVPVDGYAKVVKTL